MKKTLGISAVLIFTFSILIITQSSDASPIRSESIVWSHISSDKGELPVPSSSTQQTASLVLDIDKDGKLDFVIGIRGSPGPSLVWYKRGDNGWSRYIIDPSVLHIEAGGTMYDIDSDGDLDIVMGGDYRSQQLWWWENPYPHYSENTPWVRYPIKISGGNKHHDQLFGDFDGDGQGELVFWNQGEHKLYLAEIPADPINSQPWLLSQIYSWNGGSEHEGLTQIDVDGDGIIDIVGGGRWFKYNGGTSYTANVIDDSQRFARVAVGQLIEGGRPEIVFVSGDSTGPLRWYEWNGNSWAGHTLVDIVDHGHSLEVADINGDGSLDIFTAEMRLNGNNPEAKMWIFWGDGQGNLTQQVVETGYGNHESRIADLDGDGDLDILGKPYNWDTPRIDIWLNDKPSPLDRWTRHIVDDARPSKAIFITSADLDADNFPDIITGGWWYKNPGFAGGGWMRNTIGSPLNNMAAVEDFDNDGDLDILGTQGQGESPNPSFVWAENNGSGAFTIFDNVSPGDGDFLQGVAVDYFLRGEEQVALSWHDANKGIQILSVPTNPAREVWQWQQISSISQDESLSSGDIDSDGDHDLLLGTQWLRNDGETWTAFTIHPSSEPPDRNVLKDINQDKRLDAVVGFEAISKPGKVAWYQQGNNPTDTWTEHLIATPIGPMSLDVADMDSDGDFDVIVGEHNLRDPASARLLIYENTDGQGGHWLEHIVYTGDEHHDGAQVIDIDNDHDLDIISIGWSHSQVVVYENMSENSSNLVTNIPEVPMETPTVLPSVPSQAYPDSAASVLHGLQALYLFNKGDGEFVYDVSGDTEPLNLRIMDSSAVQWLPDGGLRINQPTILQTPIKADRLIQACKISNEISIEAWIKPADLIQDGPTRIVSLSGSPYHRNFTLGQEAGEFQVRLRTTTTSDNGIPAIETQSDTVKTSISHVVYTRDTLGVTSLYMDSSKIVDTTVGGDFSNWAENFQLLLANELTGERPWLGDYYRVAIFSQALTKDEVSILYEVGPNGFNELLVPTPVPTTSPTTRQESESPDEEPSPTKETAKIQTEQTEDHSRDGEFYKGNLLSILLGIILLLLIFGSFVWINLRK